MTIPRRIVLISTIALALVASQAVTARQPDFRLVVGSEECSSCHATEAEILERTRHFLTVIELRTRPAAAEIALRLGLADPFSEDLCLDCHLTTSLVDGERKIIEGIGCESCHGGGRNFLVDHRKEKENAAQDWARIESMGMVTPALLYELATDCYSCHLVASEHLVDVGGHTVGSQFELLSWSQGEVRHNTWYSDGKANIERGRDGSRLLFLLGRTIELESVLRAAGEIQNEGRYSKVIGRRLESARHRMHRASSACPELAVQEVLAAVDEIVIGETSKELIIIPADQLTALGRGLLERYDGSELACLDPLLPSIEHYRGEAFQPGE